MKLSLRDGCRYEKIACGSSD